MAQNLNDYYRWNSLYWHRHPLQRLRAKWKAKRERIVKGWCGLDVSNFDTWFLETIPSMLRELATAEVVGTPDGFEEQEDFQEALWHLANDFERVNGRYPEDELTKAIHDVYSRAQYENGRIKYASAEDEEIGNRYWARENEREKTRIDLMKSCFERMAQYLDYLWE